MPQLSLHAPIGDLTVSEDAGVIVALDWGWGAVQTETPLLRNTVDALQAYFDGESADFDIPLAPAGTAFQEGVWHALRQIPYGRTLSYGALARRLGTASRAVGGACAANPIPILIPCHRVVTADGALGGYSGEGGLDAKAALLRLEGAINETILA